IGLYLGMGAVGSSYGAAGSFVVLLLWLYYSTQIMLFGAEFTKLYADRFGCGMVPAYGGASATVAPARDACPDGATKERAIEAEGAPARQLQTTAADHEASAAGRNGQ